jgi:hypothetical protein
VRVAGILGVADLEKARPKESISGCTNPPVYINSFFYENVYIISYATKLLTLL